VSFKNWKAPVNESAINENTFPNAFINGFNVDNNSLRLFIKSINALLNPPPPDSVSNAFKNSLPKDDIAVDRLFTLASLAPANV
jgi:hypothetical protein